MRGIAGHYVSLIKSKNTWLFFDDDTVDIISESTVAATFGSTQVSHGKQHLFMALSLYTSMQLRGRCSW